LQGRLRRPQPRQRYRLLNASARASIDIDYHWEGDLPQKQMEIADLLHSKLLPEVKRELGYDGDIRPAAGPDADSPAVRIVEMAFYRVAAPGSRIEIPVEITRVARHDAPMVKTIAGTVFLTVSDGDMIESTILACLNRRFFQARDIVDIFLFQDTLPPDSPERLVKQLKQLDLPLEAAIGKLDRLDANRTVHVRAIDRLLAEQVNPAVTANLLAAGGALMVWDSVMRLLQDVLATAKEFSP
jgi:hypothetical protein